MNIEKRDIVPKSEKDIKDFLDRLNEKHSEVLKMLDEGTAYIQDVRDKNGVVEMHRIYRSSDGELLYYENAKLADEIESKLIQKKKPN